MANLRMNMSNLTQLGFLSTAIIFSVIALALIGWNASFIGHPGPDTVQSHFSGLVFCVILLFDGLQLLKLALWHRQIRPFGILARLSIAILWLYWVIITISGLTCAIAYGRVPKPDAVGIQTIIFLTGLAALLKLALTWWSYQKAKKDDRTSQALEKQPVTKRCVLASGRYLNRLLKSVRFMISVLFIIGAVRLASEYRFKNPGSVVHATLPSDHKVSMNYFCTAVPSANSTSLPTIWFESSAAHGVTDFLGVQTILAEAHGRNSCSYDPPNFGWSSRWPASEKLDLNTVFDPLLAAIGRQEEKKVLAGWGGGAENFLKHAKQNPETVEAVVFLDASPVGIEWLDRKRAMDLTMEETVDFAKTDMKGRITLAQIILTLGIPWGLLPVFVPANDTGYFDQAEYPRHHAQSLKEDMWAMQYYQLVDQSSNPFGTKLEDLQLSNKISVYGIATYNSGSDDASDRFYRDEKVQLANSVSAGNLTKPFIWCEESDCSLSFPVIKPMWTANALISLGI